MENQELKKLIEGTEKLVERTALFLRRFEESNADTNESIDEMTAKLVELRNMLDALHDREKRYDSSKSSG